MTVSRDTAYLNSYFSIVKGQLIDLYYFATIGPMENDQPEVFDYEEEAPGLIEEKPKPTRIRKKAKEKELIEV